MQINGTTQTVNGVTLPSGWRVVQDVQKDSSGFTRVASLRGPARDESGKDLVKDAVKAAKNAYDYIAEINPSRTEGRLVASVDVTYQTATGQVINGVELPAGWRFVSDVPGASSTDPRTAEFEGPAEYADEIEDLLEEAYPDAVDITVTEPGPDDPPDTPAEAEVEYPAPTGGGSGSHSEPARKSPDTYSISSGLTPVKLSAHPMFAGMEADILEVEDAILRGDKARLADLADDQNLATYIGLRMAGVTDWQTPAYTVQIVRHYNKTEHLDFIDFSGQGRVGSGWASISGSTGIPEPMWNDGTSDNSFEWMQVAICPAVGENETTVTYVYQGAWKWSSALYGGSWTPTVPTAS